MKKLLLCFILVCFALLNANALVTQVDTAQVDKRYLLELLEKRKALFNEYSSLNEMKTGIFKNRTKKDVMRSKQMLNNIIALDNKIINELDRMFEHNQFQKLSLGVDMLDYELQLNKHRVGISALQNEIQYLKNDKAELELQISQGKFWQYLSTVVSIFLAGILIYVLFKKRKET
ncbi:MAG: hypothetical protein HKN75_04865 [Bacteroidia bacterium]|nr:hypothetical protein [Bacteroidia bacterium]